MKRRGQTLIATLIVVVILLMLTMVFMTGGMGGSVQENTGIKARPDGRGTTVPGLVKLKAEDTVCKSNITQVRQGLQMARMSNGDEPVSSIEEAKIGASFYSCPLGNEPYEYTAATGEVRCVHPGHEKY